MTRKSTSDLHTLVSEHVAIRPMCVRACAIPCVRPSQQQTGRHPRTRPDPTQPDPTQPGPAPGPAAPPLSPTRAPFLSWPGLSWRGPCRDLSLCSGCRGRRCRPSTARYGCRSSGSARRPPPPLPPRRPSSGSARPCGRRKRWKGRRRRQRRPRPRPGQHSSIIDRNVHNSSMTVRGVLL